MYISCQRWHEANYLMNTSVDECKLGGLPVLVWTWTTQTSLENQAKLILNAIPPIYVHQITRWSKNAGFWWDRETFSRCTKAKIRWSILLWDINCRCPPTTWNTIGQRRPTKPLHCLLCNWSLSEMHNIFPFFQIQKIRSKLIENYSQAIKHLNNSFCVHSWNTHNLPPLMYFWCQITKARMQRRINLPRKSKQ